MVSYVVNNLANFHAIMKINFLRKLTFTQNQSFLQKVYTTRIWSYTVVDIFACKHDSDKSNENLKFKKEVGIDYIYKK